MAAENIAIDREPAVGVIGAGHAGLAVSRCLTDRSIDHVVLERGEIIYQGKPGDSYPPEVMKVITGGA